MLQTKYNLPLTDLTQKLSQPVLDLPQKPSQTLALRCFSPFLNKYKLPYPFLKFLSSLIPHYISLGDDYDEEDVSADVYRKVLS